jgi:hypothetical protein
MYHFTVKISRSNDPEAGSIYRVRSVEDENGQPCSGMIDINSRYQSLAALTENLVGQLDVHAQNLVLVEEIERIVHPGDGSDCL